MEFKGTKGKWLFSMDNFGKVKKENGDLVCQTFYTNSENKEEQLPNAKAISYVPEMLEFIKSIFEDYENGLIYDVEHLAIRAELLYNKATTI